MRFGELVVAFLNLALVFWSALLLLVVTGLLIEPGLLGNWTYALAAAAGAFAFARGVREARSAAEDGVGGMWAVYGPLILHRSMWLILALILGPVLVMLVTPGLGRSPDQGRLTTCKSNLKNIGTAMEMYASDFHGLYPPSASLLTPNYLRTIPTCPAAGRDSYEFTVSDQPEAFTVICHGDHHAKVATPPDHPQFNSRTGLVER